MAGTTSSVAAMLDAAARCLAHQISRIGAAERKPVGQSQPELTGLLLPFHSDDVIIFFLFSPQNDFSKIFSLLTRQHRFFIYCVVVADNEVAACLKLRMRVFASQSNKKKKQKLFNDF